MKYLKDRWKYMLFCILVLLTSNLYVFFLMDGAKLEDLIYLDFLLLVIGAVFWGLDYGKFYRREKEKQELLKRKSVMYSELQDFENREIVEHDIMVLERQLQEKIEENSELQDYVAKWCHEVKIPLSACLLMQERISDSTLRYNIREQLERIRQQISQMLLGCRTQSPVLDVQIKVVSLMDCVKAAIHNQQFFLIQNGFHIEIEVDGHVYTDQTWLVYVLDQLIGNAVKYTSGAEAKLCIKSYRQKNRTELQIEDNGEGILAQDLRRIFDKGYTGSNHHNGQYKSTGMGLYMVHKIIKQLGHDIRVESEAGKYTRFTILFLENSYYGS